MDREAASAAIREHLTVLGIDKTIRWVKDAEQGFAEASYGEWCSLWRQRFMPHPIMHPVTHDEIVLRIAAERVSGFKTWPDVAVTSATFRLPATMRNISINRHDGRHLYGAHRALPALRRAGDSGLWAFWVLTHAFVAIPPPEVVFDRDHRPHCETGAAVRWGTSGEVYFWHGIHVPKKVVLAPETIHVSEIETERNIEVRRVMIERYGAGRYAVDCGEELARDEFGVLYRKNWVPNRTSMFESWGEAEPIVVVKVRNSTAEPDGSFKDYYLRVPPTMRTPREAIAWTFGLPANDYAPEVET